MRDALIAGADIGGSHITVAFVDPARRVILEAGRERILIDAQGTAAAIIKAWADAIRACIKTIGQTPEKIGIAMPGPFDYQQGISLMKDQNKYDALYGLNIKELLSDALGMAPESICFANDAACFLQGELYAGVAEKADTVIGLTLGTGLGAARSLYGLAADANLWCSPFKDGIAEDYLSARWFVRRYAELTGNELVNVEAIVREDGSKAVCVQVFEEFGLNLGTFLLPFLRKENISTVVIGGSIAHSFGLFEPALHKYLLQQGVPVSIYQSRMGESAALLGAVSFAMQDTAAV